MRRIRLLHHEYPFDRTGRLAAGCDASQLSESEDNSQRDPAARKAGAEAAEAVGSFFVSLRSTHYTTETREICQLLPIALPNYDVASL